MAVAAASWSRTVQSQVIPAEAGIHLADMDPRLRGGDEARGRRYN